MLARVIVIFICLFVAATCITWTLGCTDYFTHARKMRLMKWFVVSMVGLFSALILLSVVINLDHAF